MMVGFGKTYLHISRAFDVPRRSTSSAGSWRSRLVFLSALFCSLIGATLSGNLCASAHAETYRIAFGSTRNNPYSNDYEIYVMNSDGSGQTRLTFDTHIDYEPNFSPDGTRILWTSTRVGHAEIYIMNADGSNQQRLTTAGTYDGNSTALWSHDGSKICYLHYDSAIRSHEIWMMNADGSNAHRITFNAIDEDRISWSADDAQIVFDNAPYNSQIYVVNADGSGSQRLITRASTDFGPKYSPLGDKIAFSSKDDFNGNGFFLPKLFSMNLDGTDLTRLGNRDGYEAEPVWSPDAAQIAFQSDVTGNRDIWVMNSDGTNAINLTNVPGEDLNPTWGPLPANLSIADATVVEGDSGTRNMVFAVSLSRASVAAISVNYATANDAPVSAVAGTDYTATSGTLSFAPGETSKTISVPVIGDTTFESAETFGVTLSGSSSAPITRARAVGTITDDDNEPVNVSLSPNAVSSLPNQARIFTTVYSDPQGADSINFVFFRVGGSGGANNTAANNAGALLCYYNVGQNKLYLAADSGAPWLGGYAPGSASTISNSQGSLSCANTTVSKSGNLLTVNWSLTPSGAFAGTTQPLSLYVRDLSVLVDGYDTLGNWTIGGNVAPVNGTIYPATATDPAGQLRLFASSYSDPNGWKNLSYVFMRIGGSASTVNNAGLLLLYYNVVTNRLYVMNDAGTKWLGGYAPGTNIVIENAQGGLNCLDTTISGSGQTLRINWSVRASASYVGTRDMQLYARDLGNLAAVYKSLATWTITSPPGGAPAQSGLSTGSASSASNTITLRFDRVLDASWAADTARYALQINGQAAEIASVRVSGDGREIVLQPASALAAGDAVTLAYNLRDSKGNVLNGRAGPLTAH